MGRDRRRVGEGRVGRWPPEREYRVCGGGGGGGRGRGGGGGGVG